MKQSLNILALSLAAAIFKAAVLCAAPATRPAAPVTRPAGSIEPAARPAAAQKSQPAVADADPRIEQLLAAIDSGDFKSISADLDQQATEELADLTKLDNAQVVTTATYREFARCFARIDAATPAQKEGMKWLLRQKHLLPVLMLALSPQDEPGQVLRLATELGRDDASAVEGLPDLATAFIVVWSKGRSGPDDTDGPPAVERVARLFNYYVHSRRMLRFDPADLPWQLSIYAIDNRASESEILWAANRYAARVNLASAYFDVRYDTVAYLTGGSKQINAHPYTLPNILQFGGVCVDQAYFATHVARSMGVPATVCTGQSGAGQVAHAWIGFLEVQGRRAVWNFSEARYKEDLFWSGQVIDPQTFEQLTDADVSLLAELQDSTPMQRLASEALCKLADVFDPSNRLDVYTRAINDSPGNRLAWAAVADLGANKKITPEQINTVTAVVQKFAMRPYPEFACSLLQHMASGAAESERVAALDKVADMFLQRPDLVARIRIQQGDILHNNQRDNDALLAYGDVLTRRLNAGPIIMEALDRVDTILRDRHDLQRLAAIYATVWSSMPVPDMSGYVRTTPYYRVGEALAQLLDDMGNHSGATTVRTKLSTLVPRPV